MIPKDSSCKLHDATYNLSQATYNFSCVIILLQTEIKPRIHKNSEHCFLTAHLKVQVKLLIKIEKWRI